MCGSRPMCWREPGSSVEPEEEPADRVADYHKDLIVRIRLAATWVKHQRDPAPDWEALLNEAADVLVFLEALRLLDVASEHVKEVIRLLEK
jgi:hypothetical protein